MNTIYLRDCVICDRYIAVATNNRVKIPSVSLRVPVIARRKSFKTCSSDCSKKLTTINVVRNNETRYDKDKIKSSRIEHKINIEIAWRKLKSRDKFIEFCKENDLQYNGNYDTEITTRQELNEIIK